MQGEPGADGGPGMKGEKGESGRAGKPVQMHDHLFFYPQMFSFI